ncbi:MAG: hypothetical protein WC313_01055 [Candidatus Kapaibacterium sp.]
MTNTKLGMWTLTISGKLSFYSLILFIGLTYNLIAESNDIPSILIGRVDVHGDSTDIDLRKFDSAMELALKLSGKYKYIGLHELRIMTAEDASLAEKEAGELAEICGASYVALAQINVVKHLLRVSLNLIPIEDSLKQISGLGYSTVNYADRQTGKILYDPALLLSVKRALADGLGDSLLFVKPELGLNVKPLPTLVIGSIAFEGDNQDGWELYDDREVSSFAAVETIFDKIKNENLFVIFDTETRDTLYKNFGFHIIENHIEPSVSEVKMLYQLAVDYYVSGKLVKNENRADLQLGLYQVTRNGLYEVKIVSEHFSDDSRMVFLEHISRACIELFNLGKNDLNKE